MTSSCSFPFLFLFLPAVIVVYQLMPEKKRPYVLLAASYLFFWLISGTLLVFLLFTTVSIYSIGKRLDREGEKRDALLKTAPRDEKKAIRQLCQKKQRRWLALGIFLQLGILLTIKYSGFFVENMNQLLKWQQIEPLIKVPQFVMPIGISFYTLQAFSYLTDVYRGVTKAEPKLSRLALYMSFFPGLMEGPICRYRDMAEQLSAGGKITYHQLTYGVQRILYGMIKKVVIADRLNPLVQELFDSGTAYDGGLMFVALFAFTCQEYMEFSGTMDVVIGTAQIFGIKMQENFERPFFSRTISEFWRRWHITLGTWFKDYIFYPVSMAGPMKKLTKNTRKSLGSYYSPLLAGTVALFCVWSLNGLWHGAGWNYIGFGMFHFMLIVLGNFVEPPVAWAAEKIGLNRDSVPWRIFQMLRTAFLVGMGEVIFRASSLHQGVQMLKTMLTSFTLGSVKNGTLFTLGIDRHDFLITGVALFLVLAVSILQERGIKIRDYIAGRKTPVRWMIYYSAVLFVVVFGAYGNGYLPIDPIYAGF